MKSNWCSDIINVAAKKTINEKGRFMEKDFENFIAKRCECALMSDENYVKKEQGENVNEIELQIIVETICYKKGFSDAMKVIKCSQEM